MLFNVQQLTSTPTMLMVSPSHMGTLVDILGHMPLDSLMMAILLMVSTTVLVPSTLVKVLLTLLDLIISVNLGITGRWQDNNRIALEDPLWDGDGCGPGNSCCAQAGMPWFCRTLPQEVSEDIEVRLCSDEGISNEEVYMELMEVYVQ